MLFYGQTKMWGSMFAIRGCHYSTYKGDEKMAISAIIEKRLLRQRVVLMCSMNKNIVVEINNLEYRDQSQCLQRAREALLSTSSIGEVGRNQGDDGTHSSEGMLRALEACAPREQQGDPLRIVSSRNRGHERRLDGIWKSMMHRVLCKRQCRIDGDPGRHFQEKGFRVDCCHGRFSVREDKS